MKRHRASTNTREHEDNKETVTRMTEMPAANQGCQRNVQPQDPSDQTSIVPATGDTDSSHVHLKPQEAHYGIYSDLDNADMDYEHAY